MAHTPTLTKTRAVAAMFDGIAGRYDLLNRLMSAGQDGRWRAITVDALNSTTDGDLLDIGAGTGDLSFAMRRRHTSRGVVGLDLSRSMLEVARTKCRTRHERRIAPLQGDVLRLPFADATFAGAATAFTFRNVPDVPAALREVRRVLRPGAAFAILEITRPSGGLLARGFRLYFHRLLPLITGLIAGNRDAYRYLPESVDRFMTGPELAEAMRTAGFQDVTMRRFWPGAVTLHVGHYRG